MSSNKKLSVLFISAILIFSLTAVSCDNEDPFRVDYSLAEEMLFDTTGVQKQVMDSGLVIYYVEEGTGDLEVVIRDNLLIYYTGRRTSNNSVFESTYANGRTLPLQLNGLGSTSRGNGFIEGVLGMKVDEKRVLVIPPELSNYGETVIYDVEVGAILY